MGIGIDSNNYLWFGGTTGGHNGTKNSTYFYTDTSGNVVANTSFQAPIFRDSSDPTNYYVDPNATSRIRKTNLIASGSAWDDGLNLYSSDATNRWNLLVDDGAADAFRIAYNNSEALNINTSRNVTAAVDFRAPIFYDNNTAYYFNGDGTTNLLNLTVNGTLTVSSFGSNQINLGVQRQYYVGNLGAAATQAKRYEVARLFVDVANWHDAGVMLVELQSQYYAGGDYQVWSVNYDYGGATGNVTCRLIAGDSPRGRFAQVTTGTPVQISGNYYYVSVYVDVRYYSSYYTFVKTSQTANSSATAANSGAAWVFTTPAAGANIADFTPSTTVTTNNTLQSTADMRAPIFYDNDNTGYYVDPNSTSNFNEVKFQNGKWATLTNNSGNSTDMYIRPDGNDTYIWRMIFGGSGTGYGTGAGGFGIYNQTLAGDYSAIFPSSGYAVFPYSVRSPIYYDYTDTTYFVDPNSNSYINFLRAAGNMQANGGAIAIPTSYKNVPGVTPGTTGDWKRGSSNLIMAGSQNTDGTGWSYGSRLVNLDYGDGLGMSVDVNYNNGWTNDALFVSGRSGRIGNIGINQTAPSEKLDIIGKLKITSANNNGYGWIYSTDTNHSIIIRGDRDGTLADHTNYYQYGGTYANARGHRFWTGGAIAAQTEKFRISDNVTASFQQIYAPSLYDINDTGYYLDPNGTSNLYRGYFAQLMKRNNRFSNGDRYPLGHYSDGDMVWNIDPSWSEYELQEYFGSSNVTWVADSTAPGGYAIQIAGGTNVFTNGSGSGFPMIPIDSADDVFYMEVWMKGISGTANHYMGSVDFNESFGNLGGNPGSYGYWVLVGNVPGTSWSKWYGYIGGFGTAYGTFKVGAKYWSPMALFNYSGGTSYMSGWKVLRVNRQTSMIINTPNGNSSTGASNSRGQTLTIKRSNTAQLDLGSYPGAWTSALQIQNNDASAWLWMSPLTGYTPTIATNYGAINYYTTAQNGGFAGSMNNGSFRSPLFYDSDNTAYYLDPNADLALKVYGEISNSNYAEGNLQPGALNIGRTDTNYNWGGSWSGNVLTGILANCADNWEMAIHDSGSRVVSPFVFWGGASYYLEMGRDIGWGTMPIYATNSFRAPIFYDSADTSYYVDPNSTSYIRSLFLGAHDSGAAEFRFGEDSSGWYGDRWYWDSSYTTYRYSRFAGTDSLIHYHDTRDTTRITYGRNIVFDNYGKGIVGTYDATRYQGVFAMGDSYKLPADGSGTGNLYGLAWSHPNAGGIAGNLADHGLLLLQNGTFRGAWGGGSLRTPGDVRGTLFYDWNDTSYYCDPNSESNLYKPTYYTQQNWSVSYRAVGRSRITGDQNYWTNTTGWGTSYGTWATYWQYGFGGFDCWGTGTDHPQGGGYVHAQGIQSGLHNANSDGSIGYGWQMVGAADATANRYWARGKWGGTTSAWKEFAMYGGSIASSMYASIYYDADDTTYYGNFNGNSFIYQLTTQSINGSSIFIGNQGVSTSNPLRINFHTDGDLNYYIGKPAGAWTQPLHIAFYTGIKLGAEVSYGGTRFYNSSNMATEIASHGNGDNHTRILYNLYAPIMYDYNDSTYYVDPASGSRLGYQVAISGNASGSVGNRLLVGSTTVNYSLQDTNLRPTVHIHGQYPVLSLNHTVTSNTNHGPTIQFTSNGTGNQFVIGTTGNGSALDMGYASAGDWNPHNGISGYNGVTFFRATSGGNVGIGSAGDWGGLGGGDPGYPIDTRGTLYNNTDVRAPIFYDSNNTAYYLDPASTSILNKVYMDSNTVWRNYGIGPVGTYTSTRYQGVFSMGESYILPSDGSSTGSLYGLAWSHPNAGGVAANLNTHGLLAMENGTWLASLSGSVRARDDMRAPIFYDSNNTAFYADFYSATVSINAYGRIYAGAGVRSGTYGAINSSGFNTNVVGTANASYTGGGCGHPPWGGTINFGAFVNVNGGGLGALWSGNGSTYYGGEPGSVFYGGNGDYTSGGGAGIFAQGGDGGYYAMAGAGIYARGGNNGYWFNINAYTITRAPAAYFDGNVYIMTPSGSTQCGLNIGYFEYTSNSNSTYVLRANGPGYFNGRLDATVFYDANDNTYYVDPAATSNIFNLQITGSSHKYLYINPGNGYEAMVRYNGGTNSGWYVGKRTSSQLVGTGDFHFYSEAAGQTVGGIDSSGNIYARDSMVAPIFYDRNDTAYYADPNSNSNMYKVTAYQGAKYSTSDWADGFRNTPVSGRCFHGDISAGGPSGTWWFYDSMRHSNASSYWGTQIAYGWEDNANNIYQRNIQGNSFSGWVRYLNSGNYGGYSNFSGAVYGTIFYDANDNGYYCDPNGTTRLSTLNVVGDITVGVGQGNSNIYFYDSDEGTRRMHCNSNRLGFLNDSNAWGAYCSDNGDWTTDFIGYAGASFRAPIFYDNNNTAYYCDPNGYSQFSSGQFNNYVSVQRIDYIGVGGNSGNGWNGYSTYQEGGAWTYPYPDLNINFHTGIKIGAYYGYNGTRFYNNSGGSNDVLLGSFGDGDYNFRSYYNIIAYASDERLKENIVNIPNALEKLQQLNGVTFDWKAMVTDLGFEPTAWHEVGVLAQQVEAVLPEAVEVAPFDYDWKNPGQSKSGERYLTVKYEKIVPLLIEAIKDQQKIINDQEARISRLESLIEKFNL